MTMAVQQKMNQQQGDLAMMAAAMGTTPGGPGAGGGASVIPPEQQMSGQTPCAKRPVTKATIEIVAGGNRPMSLWSLRHRHSRTQDGRTRLFDAFTWKDREGVSPKAIEMASNDMEILLKRNLEVEAWDKMKTSQVVLKHVEHKPWFDPIRRVFEKQRH